jgi:hypothetical protein
LLGVLLASLVSVSACAPAPSKTYRSALEGSAHPATATIVATESPSSKRLLSDKPLRFDAGGLGYDPQAALNHATAIAAFGVRVGGSPQERQAAEYVAARLRDCGLTPSFDEFRLPNGRRSVNVSVVISGANDDRRVLLGSHLDSKPPSPGANDTASGCGVLLEFARILAKNPPPVTTEIIFWGTEEFIDVGRDHHHQGSRHDEDSMTPAQRKRLAAVLSIDMVGVGTRFHVRTMGRGPQTLRQMLLSDARKQHVSLTYLHDPGPTGWSDHEPYERAGIPAVWLEWQPDSAYHMAGDTAARLQIRPMRITGDFVLDWLFSLDDSRIAKLDKR